MARPNLELNKGKKFLDQLNKNQKLNKVTYVIMEVFILRILYGNLFTACRNRVCEEAKYIFII